MVEEFRFDKILNVIIFTFINFLMIGISLNKILQNLIKCWIKKK